jgi:hypothetical protein
MTADELAKKVKEVMEEREAALKQKLIDEMTKRYGPPITTH